MAMWHRRSQKGKGGRKKKKREEFKAVQGQTKSGILSLANVPLAEGKIPLTPEGVGEK